MNKIKAKLVKVKSSKNLNLLEFEFNSYIIKAVILQYNLNLKIGEYAKLSIKPTSIYLSKNKIDFDNIIKAEIVSIKKGEILSQVICKVKDKIIEVVMLNENINVEKEGYLLFRAFDVGVEID